MLDKLSTRRYQTGLEPVGTRVEQTATGTSRSAGSRRFVARTEHAPGRAARPGPDRPGPGALMVDDIGVAEHW
jgi:putative transposase